MNETEQAQAPDGAERRPEEEATTSELWGPPPVGEGALAWWPAPPVDWLPDDRYAAESIAGAGVRQGRRRTGTRRATRSDATGHGPDPRSSRH